jgi:hypothetical protein
VEHKGIVEQTAALSSNDSLNHLLGPFDKFTPWFDVRSTAYLRAQKRPFHHSVL